jgi:ribonucleoside-triphosphate reductase (thioredoxin)
MFLQPQFLEQYGNYAGHQSAISKFTYLRTYSRYLPQLGRREHWKETAKRAVDFSLTLEYNHRKKLGLPIDFGAMRQEAEELFDSMFNLKQFVSGRTLWVGGADNGLAEKFALANFNCSFTNVSEPNDLADIFYVLLVGTGAGLKANKQLLKKFPAVYRDFQLVNQEYNYVGSPGQLENSFTTFMRNKAIITVGDSKEGWVEALRMFFTIITDKYNSVETVEFDYNFIRPAGTRLKTFGGTASGPEPLMEMFEGFRKVIQNEIDPSLAPIEVDEDGYGKLRPIHIVDMANLIGYNVVVGGVRRTAEIVLGDADDFEFIFAKYGMNGLYGEEAFENHYEVGRLLEANGIPKPAWFDEIGVKNWDEFTVDENGEQIPFNYGRQGLGHRSMSNNSIAFTEKPAREKLHLVFTMMKGEGEPGFVNLREMAIRRLDQMGYDNPSEYLIQQMTLELGMNPCAEINLRSKGVCNLSTINVKGFVADLNGKKILLEEQLLGAQRLSARIGIRMTLIQLELPEWDKTQQLDRLTGNSLTGWKDAMDEVNYGKGQQRRLLKALRRVAREEADLYAKELRVNAPLLTTTVKPEGTQSIVANAVSSGLHHSHSPYYIRRIRINAQDPLAKAVRAMGWDVMPENFTPGETHEERMANARTLVISFPVASGAKRTKEDISVEEQLETYFDFQKYYAEHNSSNTITIKSDEEWGSAEDIIFEEWDEFTAVSFLALKGGSYQQTPYEAITKEKYDEMVAAMPEFDESILAQFESNEEFDITDEDCATGACPTR